MGLVVALVVAAAAGFIALSYEILWYRVISYASWGLPGAFGLLLSAYLLGLALGSRIAGAFCKDQTRAGDKKQLRSLAGFTFVANLVAWLVVPAFGWSAKRWDWPPALIAVAVAAALLGAILPLVAHFGIKPDDKAGANLSYIYLANIVGSAGGSLITGFVFLDLWPLQTIGAIVACVGMALAAALMLLSDTPSAGRLAAASALAVVAIALVKTTPVVYDRIWERLLYKRDFNADTRFLDVVETKSGVITVTQQGVVYGGGAYDGKVSTSITSDVNGIFRAHAVGAMHDAPKNVLMVGLATGAWAQVVANIPGVEKLTVVEINPGYLDLIAKYEPVRSLLQNPRVHIVVDDGRRWLHRHPDDKFDFIVMNTTWNWRGHSTNLLSVEFLELARAHLEPGGVLYYNTTSSDDVKKTAATVFPYALRVYNFIAVSDAPLTFDKERYRKTLSRMRIDGQPIADTASEDGKRWLEDMVNYADTLHESPTDEGLESRESVLSRANAAGARVITDDNMVPEWRKVLRFQEPP
jgi:spermidine synthase